MIAPRAVRARTRWPVRPTLLALGLGLGAACCLALARGAVAFSPRELLAGLGDAIGVDLGRAVGLDLDLGELPAQRRIILWSIRAPRVALAALVGAALGSAGATLQGAVRNPLADPGLVGVSSGAALGAIGWLVLGAHHVPTGALGAWLLPAAAFAGALVTTAISLGWARVDGQTSAATLLLGGVGISSLAGAACGLLLHVADDAALRSITFWSLGSLGGATWSVVGVVAIPLGVALVAMPRCAGELDRLALGEREARHVGVDVERAIRRAAALASLAVGAAVAACGIIGFVGLVVPHLARGVLGPGHRALLPASALGGALLLVLADLAARTVVAPAELPVGTVTALVGAPVLLALVRRGRLDAGAS